MPRGADLVVEALTAAGVRQLFTLSPGSRAIGCELLPTRYDRMAEALGAHGEHVQRPDDLAPALARAVASGRPACVNVVIDGAAAPAFARGATH